MRSIKAMEAFTLLVLSIMSAIHYVSPTTIIHIDQVYLTYFSLRIWTCFRTTNCLDSNRYSGNISRPLFWHRIELKQSDWQYCKALCTIVLYTTLMRLIITYYLIISFPARYWASKTNYDKLQRQNNRRSTKTKDIVGMMVKVLGETFMIAKLSLGGLTKWNCLGF